LNIPPALVVFVAKKKSFCFAPFLRKQFLLQLLFLNNRPKAKCGCNRFQRTFYKSLERMMAAAAANKSVRNRPEQQ